jgi:hypothetical protein
MSILTPEQDPASPVQKPGIKTTELVMAVAAVLAGVLPVVLDMLPPDSKWIGIVGAILAAATYIAGRAHVKATGAKAAALVEAAKAAPPSGPTLG